MSFTATVASHKGGVGKTTTVLNVGFALARGGSRVLLVDADPQGGLGHATHLAARSRGGVAQVLRGGLSLEDAITPTRDPMLAVLGNGAEEADDVALLEDGARDGALGQILRDLPGRWDFVLVDAPAGTGSLLQALLGQSDGLLAVTTPRALSVRGIPALLKAHERAEQANPRLRFVGLLVTMLDALQRADWDLRRRLQQELPAGALFRTAVPLDQAVEAASQRCLPLALAERAERSAAAYAEVAAEFRLRAAAARAPDGAQGGEAPYGLF